MAKKKLVLYELEGKTSFKFETDVPKRIKDRRDTKEVFSESSLHTVKRIKLLRIKGLSEAKTVMHSANVKTPFGSFSTQLPTAYIRKGSRDVVLDLKVLKSIYNNYSTFEEGLTKCAKKELAIIIPLLLSGETEEANKIISKEIKDCMLKGGWKEGSIEVNICLLCSNCSWERI